jgi:F-type H+-transporting ATPase subunit b
MELLGSLGIDAKLIVAQVINFTVLAALLYKFLYRPIIGVLEERERKVKESVLRAEEVEKRWQNLAGEEKKHLAESHRKAAHLLEEARKVGKEEGAELRERAKRDIERLVREAKEEIEGEKEKAREDLKREVGELVILASSKVLGVSARSVDKELVEDAIKKL